MTTTLSAHSNVPAAATLVSPEKKLQLNALRTTVAQFREALADPHIDETTKMYVQSEAIESIERQLKPLLGNVMKLMNSPLGFKTDRPPGGKDRNGNPVQPYSQDTVCRCVIQALLKGAHVVGNQFNIIAGTCYLTKEFFRPAILKFPGVSNLVLMHGSHQKHGDRTMICEAIATWNFHGKPQELKFTKTESLDARIIVNAYSTSSPDEIRGKVEAKIYSRVYSVLTGMNWEEDSEPKSGVIEGTVLSVSISEPEPACAADDLDEESNEASPKPISDSEAAKEILGFFVESLQKAGSVNEVKAMLTERRKLVESHAWSDDLKFSTIDSFIEAAEDRIASIRAARGQASNKADA
jgi:hypothetical protein